MPTSMAGFMTNEQTQAAFTAQEGKSEARVTIPEEIITRKPKAEQTRSPEEQAEFDLLRAGGAPDGG